MSWTTIKTQTFEAEQASNLKDCLIESLNRPFIGTGYVKMPHQGSSIEWESISVPSPGTYILLFKYANGSENPLPCDLIINGQKSQILNFPPDSGKQPTLSWCYYWNGRATVFLAAGKNIIALTANSLHGGPNIDNLSVSGPTLSQPQPPVITIVSNGAKPNDSEADNTHAIQSAIDSCASGGTVLVNGGTFMTGSLKLKGDMTLWIAPDSSLKAIRNETLFPPLPSVPASSNSACKRALLFAVNAPNLTITGGGTIDENGLGSKWNGSKTTPDPNTEPDPWDPNHHHEAERPIPLWIQSSENLVVRNIDFIHSVMWTIVPDQCENVQLDGVNIDNRAVDGTFPNETIDGIDPIDCHHVSLTNCSIITGDDVICPKSYTARGVSDLLASNITGNSTNDNFIKFGTPTYAYFRNMVFKDMAAKGSPVRPTHGGLTGISLAIVDGGDVDNILFDHLQLDNFGCPIFILNGAGRRHQKPREAPLRVGPASGKVQNVLIRNLLFRNPCTKIGAMIMGTQFNDAAYPVEHIKLENLDMIFRGGATHLPGPPFEYGGAYPESDRYKMLPAWGFYLRHANDIQFLHCKIQVEPKDVRPPYEVTDTRDVIHID